MDCALFFKSVFALFFSAALLFSSSTQGQVLKKIKEFRPGKIENVSIDRLGNFFLIFKNGRIKKYNANGKVLASLKNEKSPTLIEPWFHPKIFVYEQVNHTWMSYDRNFKNNETYPLDPSVAISPLLVCPTGDNKLLVLDKADYSIKSVNPFRSEVTSEFYLDSAENHPDFIYLRAYQNLIFLLDKNSGIHIYNKEGKKVNQLKTTSNNFGFFGEELYFIQLGKIVFFDLYTEKIRELKIADARFVLVSDERILLVSSNDEVSIFEFSADKLKD